MFDRKALPVALLLGVAALGAIAFAVDAALGGQTQIGGLTLGLAFAALAAALVTWEHQLMRHEDATEEMLPERSDDRTRADAEATFADGATTIVARRPWLARTLAGTVGIVGAALLFPLRSLAPKAGDAAYAHTSWAKGLRLVREDGRPVMASDLAVDSVVTVFPEGHVGPNDSDDMANTATMLVRVPPNELRLPPERAAGAPDGLIALSKVCTHAGCPVALYRAGARELFCPCHQSTFDVLTGGERIFGPAARGLPQLPIEIAADGSLRALGDFPEPIGPGYWDRA